MGIRICRFVCRFVTISLIVIPGAWSAVAEQAAPAMINFQGVLTENGVPLSGKQDVQFRIYDQPAGGRYLWGREFPVFCNDNGQFNILLNDGGKNISQSTTSLIDVFDEPNRFFELQIAGSSAPIQPRQQIVSAPFALQAQHAESASGASGDFTVTNAIVFSDPDDVSKVASIEGRSNAQGENWVSVAEDTMRVGDGWVEFNGEVFFNGAVSVFGEPENWGNGCVSDDYQVTWNIEQDGFVLFHNKDGIKVKVLDANEDTIIEMDHDDCIGSVLVPVRSGNYVRIADCDYGVWWFPLGGAGN